MEDLVKYIAQNIVSKPEEVSTELVEDADSFEIQLNVSEKDLGRIIGRRGIIAKNIRTILKAISLKQDKRYTLKIIEND